MSDDCIEFDGYRTPLGYGKKYHDGRMWLAHRLVMTELHVPIAGMFVMHRCDNPPCVNPEHLTVGTCADNNADMWSKGRGGSGNTNGTKTHCPQGHSYDEANTYVTPQGWRRCRICKRTHRLRYEACLRKIAASPEAS